MGGILNHCSIEEAAVQAVLAGTDLIEICRDPSLVLRAYEAILTEAERSAAFRKRIANSSRRVTESKHRHLNAHPGSPRTGLRSRGGQMPRPASAAQIDKLRESVKKFSGEIQ
jgi:beta-N-acetylhexosaminidase